MVYGLSLWEERFCTCRIETAQWMNFHLYWENNGMTEIGNDLADQAWTKAPQTSSPARKDPTCGIFHLYTYDIENTPTSLGKSSVLRLRLGSVSAQRRDSRDVPLLLYLLYSPWAPWPGCRMWQVGDISNSIVPTSSVPVRRLLLILGSWRTVL